MGRDAPPSELARRNARRYHDQGIDRGIRGVEIDQSDRLRLKSTTVRTAVETTYVYNAMQILDFHGSTAKNVASAAVANFKPNARDVSIAIGSKCERARETISVATMRDVCTGGDFRESLRIS